MEKEVLDRVRRIETRLHVICDALNIDPGNSPNSSLKIVQVKKDLIEIHMSSVDIPLSRIRRAIRDIMHGEIDKCRVELYCNNEKIGDLYPS